MVLIISNFCSQSNVKAIPRKQLNIVSSQYLHRTCDKKRTVFGEQVTRRILTTEKQSSIIFHTDAIDVTQQNTKMTSWQTTSYKLVFMTNTSPVTSNYTDTGCKKMQTEGQLSSKR